MAGALSCTESSGPETPEATGLWVTPSTVRLTALADTVRLTADVRDQNGHVMDGAAVAWSSSDVSVAAVDGGLVRAVGNGTATVTATSGQASGSAEVEVEQEASAVEVTPTMATPLAAVGDTVRLAAAAVDANGHPVAGAVFEWSSDDGAVAAVDSAGLVTAVGNGTATVTAASGQVSGSADITVEQEAASVGVVSGAGQRGAPGSTLPDTIVVQVRDAGGSPVESAAVSFTLAADHGTADPGSVLSDAEGLARTVWTLGSLEGGQSLTAASGSASVQITAVANPDRAALVAVYNATDGPNWVNNENWLTDAPLDEWHGVSVDGAGRVTGLSLGENNLTGIVPPELRDLAGLKYLYLYNNALSGPIPPELGNLSSLRWLWLSANALHGPIPPELGSLASLEGLYLSGNDLSGPVPRELGNLSSLRWLYLSGNDLSGPIPPELGSLASLESLSLSDNVLHGPIPSELGDLASLRWLYLSDNPGLCVPGTGVFGTLVASLEFADFSWCNEADAAALEALHASAGGEGWKNQAGWLDGTVLADWHGVTADSLGRVTALDLADNGLAGVLPAGLGELARLRELRLGRNPLLSGRLPAALARLSLDVLDYAGTTLCVPAEAMFQAWLARIGVHAGTDLDCVPLTDRDALEALYNATGGQSWADNANWLTDKPLGDWYGVTADSHGRVTALYLYGNALDGRVSPELGGLASLEGLSLSANALHGPIPSELGNLASLEYLGLSNNALSGPIPPELGSLAALERLSLAGNALEGPIPPELGNLASLQALVLANNAGLEGALPAALTGLRALDTFQAGGTGLCAPPDPVFLEWLAGVWNSRVLKCAGAVAAYVTQAVQSRDFPVPLVAGEEALLRVFVTASDPGGATLPPVRVRFYLYGAEVRVAEIPATPHPIPEEVDEGTLSTSANVMVSRDLVQPGLELVIEVDPEGTLDPALGAAKRIPAEGRLAVDVREMPVFDLTVIPFLWREDPDSAIIAQVEGMSADPQNHELLRQTADLLPVGGWSVTAHAPVLTSSNSAHDVLRETSAIRVMEGGAGHYMGMLPRFSDWGGVANLSGRASASVLHSKVIAHELGHNFSLGHGARLRCGRPGPGLSRPARRNRRLGVCGPEAGGLGLRVGLRPGLRCRQDGPARHSRCDVVLRQSRMDQRVPLHEGPRVPHPRRSPGCGGHGRRTRPVPAPVGRRGFDGDALPGARLRRRRPALASGTRRRVEHRGPGRGRHRAVRAPLRHAARRRRRGGGRRVRLRASRPSGMGGVGRPHPFRTGRDDHFGRLH